jgi:uncharacterized protein YdhG (YjbR/CyaY superfamily)
MKDPSSQRAVDEYIAAFPSDVQTILKKIRATVKSVVPHAEERISYRMPAFFQNGVLIYFAGFKNHIGIYPPVRGDEKLLRALARYRGPKGNLKFPIDKPIPYRLIGRIVKSRVASQLTKANAKQKRTS